MELRLTGCSVELDTGLVVPDAGEPRHLTGLEAALLRHLAARPGVDLDREDLVRDVWGGIASERAVDSTVKRLRAKLGEPARPRHLLTAHGRGYRFALPRDKELVQPPSEPGVALAAGELHLAARRFVRDGQSVELSGIEIRVLEHLARELGRSVPRQELIAAIWGRGRHDDALDATVARLRRKIEPDPSSPVTLLTTRGHGFRLLGPETAWFARRPEEALVREALRTPGLATLHGTAGLGKTSLARAIAQGWTPEARFCDLTRVGTAEGLAARVTAALGADATSDATRVGRMLAARPPGSLVVLDNFEQLAPVAGVVARWVAAAPEIRLR